MLDSRAGDWERSVLFSGVAKNSLERDELILEDPEGPELDSERFRMASLSGCMSGFPYGCLLEPAVTLVVSGMTQGCTHRGAGGAGKVDVDEPEFCRSCCFRYGSYVCGLKSIGSYGAIFARPGCQHFRR